jgi:hypothetical protein
MRFAVIETEDSTKWEDGFSAYMVRHFRIAADDEWVKHHVAAGAALPSLEEHWDGVIITGSHYNVRDEKPWQRDLADWVRAVHARGAPRLLGICFGHQIVAAALGGAVDYNPGRRFVLKAEALSLTPAFAELPFVADVVLADRGAAVDVGDERTRVWDLSDDIAPEAGLEISPPSDAAANERSGAAAMPAPPPRDGAAATPVLRVLESHGDCVSQTPPVRQHLVRAGGGGGEHPRAGRRL